MKKTTALLCLSLCLFGCRSKTGSGVGAPNSDTAPPPEPVLADVESRLLTSTVSKRTYQISVALPLGYQDSEESYPVLYAVDANGQFGTVVESARLLGEIGAHIPRLIIVGIGYPVGGRQANAEPHRLLDLFPTEDREFQEWHEASADMKPPSTQYDGYGGGAAEFLRFLRDELIPMVDAEYRTDPMDRALYGHSAGGYFALYAVLEDPETFQRIIAGSPSLFWDNGHFFQFESSYFEREKRLPVRAFLSVGVEEANDNVPELGCFCMVDNLRRLERTLEARSYEDLQLQVRYFEGENHVSVIPGTISRGLRYIYGATD